MLNIPPRHDLAKQHSYPILRLPSADGYS